MMTCRWDSILIKEHEMIERVLDVMRRELKKLSNNTHDAFSLKRGIEFLLEFGARVHNQKEEQVLFLLLEKKGVSDGGLIHEMRLDHETELELLSTMAAEVQGYKKRSSVYRKMIQQKGLEYIKSRVEHIWKEKDVVFNLARQSFSAKDDQDVLDRIQQIHNRSAEKYGAGYFDQMMNEIELGLRSKKNLTSYLTRKQVDGILEALPYEITFINEKDLFTYFNHLNKPKIFKRLVADLGNEVVTRHRDENNIDLQVVIDSLKSGHQKKVEFCFEHKSQKIYITYLPVFDDDDCYLGVLEMTQDAEALDRFKKNL